MPWITPEPKQTKEALTLKIDVTVLRQLGRYAAFLGSSQSYVVAEILRDVFSRDKDFQGWRRKQGDADVSVDGASDHASMSAATSARPRARATRTRVPAEASRGDGANGSAV